MKFQKSILSLILVAILSFQYSIAQTPVNPTSAADNDKNWNITGGSLNMTGMSPSIITVNAAVSPKGGCLTLAAGGSSTTGGDVTLRSGFGSYMGGNLYLLIGQAASSPSNWGKLLIGSSTTTTPMSITSTGDITTTGTLNVTGGTSTIGAAGSTLNVNGTTIINGTIKGNQTGGALRINTTYGTVDIGAQTSANIANINTDRDNFLFNKSLYITTGIVNSNSTSNLYLQTGTTNRLTILNSNGNVGIGTAAPVAKLEVDGDVSGNGTYIKVNNTSTSNYAIHAYNGTNSLLFVRNDGKVGIGTNSLNPNYLLTVNGSVVCTKLTITDSTQITTIPDYVFKPSYELRSLNEVENYVKENNHLPEVPSASEIAKNGYDVVQMNSLLLKKVEEITLYLIDLKKENEALKAKVEGLTK